jgi:cell surface protein SprA
MLLVAVDSFPQYNKTKMSPPPPSKPELPNGGGGDSIPMLSPVKPTVPTSLEDYQGKEYAADLNDPENVKTEVIYDPSTKMYYIYTKLGDRDLVTPFQMSAEDYNKIAVRESLHDYFKTRNAEIFEQKDKEAFNILDMNFALGPLEKIFGPGGVRLTTQGSVQLSMGIKSNKTDNPALSLNSRRKTYFDFDSKIQATINASVGDKMKFNMTYNTDATFDFDSKNLKLAYEGKEDEIIKSIEAGNVSMTTGSSLIRGGTALFGVKTKLQFGKLTLTGLLSQQNSESKTVTSSGGVQTTPFSVKADEYDANRHFFLAQYFYDNYDKFASKLPYVSSGVNITRIEVWVTNKSGNYNESRNFVGFMDLGENTRLASDFWNVDTSLPIPTNSSNDLLTVIKTDYPGARNISDVTQALAPLQDYGIYGGRDYEKVESARLLSSSEYTLNSTLGYISLKSALNSDEVLGVAYEYTYQGKVYQVGEFSSDVSSTSQSLYLKMLRGTTISPTLPMWKLMMKNVYSLGAYQMQSKNFKLNIKYLSDSAGMEITYLPVGDIANKPLLQVMNLDRLDSNQESNSDGFFDYIEGYTVQPSSGKVIFPVAEPFGKNLEDKIGNAALAEPYVYKELYDSTLVVARQFSDKNKFSLVGEYQASGGAQIRLNAMNVARGSVVVTAGGTTLTENSDYTVDYNMGIVTITNQSIVESGTSISVSLENQSTFSMQRKTLLGLDAQYKFSKDFTLGATLLNFSEKALTEKVNIGDEVINNTMWGLNLNYNTKFSWLTNLLNKVPTMNLTQPSSLTVNAEFAQLVPHQQKTGSSAGSSYIDDFESTQTGIDLRSPYSWFLASTPYDGSANTLFPEAGYSNNVDYGKNRALLSWYYIDRIFTQKNSSMLPGYLKNDLDQLSNPYVREVNVREIYPNRDLNYGESSTIQTLNLSFYPKERGPYNLDAENIDDDGNLTNPEKRWGGIMRKMDNTNFDSSNIEYLEFWMLDPFLDESNPNTEGGDLYFNFGEVSEDILKDGMKSYENGNPVDGNRDYMSNTVWGRVSTQNSLTYAFENTSDARLLQDVGLDGLSNDEEYEFSSYKDYLDQLRNRLPATKIAEMQDDPFSPMNDPAGDNYEFFRSNYYDENRVGILDRYKHYNGLEGNSLSPEQSSNSYYQSSRNVPDVEDINQDNTLNEYERYYQYKVSIRPEDLEIGKNYITDKQESMQLGRNGDPVHVVWYQFKIPLNDPEKVVGNISDFSTIRFARMFMTGFKETTHLRFATLELVRGEWRPYNFNLNARDDSPAEGSLDISTVNIEENSGQKPVNYILPPGVTRIQDPGQSQAVQLNEQSMAMKVTDLQAGDARGVYRNTQLDLRVYKRLQMWVHAEALIDDPTNLANGDLAMFIRLGSDVKSNYYEYEVPLQLTPAGNYSNNSTSDRQKVWPIANYMNIPFDVFTDIKTARNKAKSEGQEGVNFVNVYSGHDPDNAQNTVSVLGNPSLSDVRVMLIGVRNKSNSVKDGTVWVNELKVTDFDEEGGWAAKTNVNLAMSDLATVNFSSHNETAGFGSVDQGLSSRRMDDYKQYTVAVQANAGKVLPEKAKLSAPIYYSRSNETTTPKYNPLDQDILLKDALKAATTKQEKDSIKNYAVTTKTVESFSISGLKFDVKSKNPMPWDPTNFTFSFSFNKQRNADPNTEYEYTNDYHGSLQYSYSPYVKGWKPFSGIKSKNKNMKFLKDWELNWMFNSISYLNNISRYYYEEQTRSDADVDFQLPVQVSKNFLWNRQLNLTWNLTKSLNFSFANNTTARIEETVGAVNKKLFPDKYREWRDTVWSSIKGLGTPWNYNQTFTASYKAPFNKIPVLDFLTANVSYNATYKWDRGATVEDVYIGNSIQNNAVWNADAKFNFESFFNKFEYLKRINQRFSSSSSARNSNKKQSEKRERPKKFERAITLEKDTSVVITHNLKTKSVKIVAMSGSNPVKLETKIIDENKVEILTRGDKQLKLTITEVKKKEEKNALHEIGDYTVRFLMTPRSVSFKYRNSKSMTLPLFAPNIGDIFGQSKNYGPMAPGLDFAFGFIDESYIDKALERGWMVIDDNQTSPAIWTEVKEYNFELNLEPIRGLKILLTSNLTDNRTKQMQFMYADIPTTYTGSYTRTQMALATALKSSKASNGYQSDAFDQFIANIPTVANRVESAYHGMTYPSTGFLSGNPVGGTTYNPELGTVSQTSPDVLIPAFIAAYTGQDAKKITLSHFPGLSSMRPNWRVTYDGLGRIEAIKKIFKSFTLSHAYQCTYSVGSYTSYLDWISVDGDLGFTNDQQTGNPIPSSPYNISSVAITEKFAPLIGFSATLQNDLTLNAEYRDSRTLTLNTSAGQIVEATSKQFTVGAGYKIANFSSIIKIGSKQGGVSNDLSLNLDFSFSSNQSLIRKIESAYSQATNGSQAISINFMASYILSKRVTMSAFFDHQINKPLVTNASFPTTNSNYGISLNLSLAR